jgi:hypothetical protein
MVFIGRDLVVHERVVVSDVPERDHEVALDTRRPRGRRRHVALGDALGPVGVGLQRSLLALVVDDGVHRVAADAGAEPPFPRLGVCLELRLRLQHVVDAARELVAELMTEVAVRFERVDPVVLRLHPRSESVALGSGSGKLFGRGRLEQREPIIPRVDLRRLERRLRDDRGERQRVGARLGLDRRRIDQAVASHPDPIGRRRQLGKHEPALIVGDDDLDEVGRQVLGLGNDPDAGFRTLRTLDHT